MGRIAGLVENGKYKIREYKSRSPDGSPYWEDFHEKKHEGEDSRANPDVLEDKPNNRLWPSKQSLQSELESDVLEELQGVDFATFLTAQELKFLKLLLLKNSSYKEIGNEIGLSRQRVNALRNSVAKKIKKYLGLGD